MTQPEKKGGGALRLAELPSVKEMKKDLASTGRLSHRNMMFIYNYISNGGNATKAILDTGYTGTSASSSGAQLLANPKIQEAISRHFQYKLEAAEVTFDWKVKMLKDMLMICITGEGLKEGLASPTGLVACIGELNKMQGDHAPDKHLHAHAEIDLRSVEKLIRQYQKEY